MCQFGRAQGRTGFAEGGAIDVLLPMRQGTRRQEG